MERKKAQEKSKKSSRPVGRPTSYTPEIGERICAMIADGYSLEFVCYQRGLPCSDTVRQWKAKHPEFAAIYARAREEAGDLVGQRVMELANQVVRGKLSPEAGRVAIDAAKWTAARMNRAVWGDKSEVAHSGEVASRLVIHLGPGPEVKA